MLDDCPELSRARANIMPAAKVCVYYKLHVPTGSTEYAHTLANMLYDQVVRVEQSGRDHGAGTIREEHGGRNYEDSMQVTE